MLVWPYSYLPTTGIKRRQRLCSYIDLAQNGDPEEADLLSPYSFLPRVAASRRQGLYSHIGFPTLGNLSNVVM